MWSTRIRYWSKYGVARPTVVLWGKAPRVWGRQGLEINRNSPISGEIPRHFSINHNQARPNTQNIRRISRADPSLHLMVCKKTWRPASAGPKPYLSPYPCILLFAWFPLWNLAPLLGPSLSSLSLSLTMITKTGNFARFRSMGVTLRSSADFNIAIISLWTCYAFTIKERLLIYWERLNGSLHTLSGRHNAPFYFQASVKFCHRNQQNFSSHIPL
jgi:hypothetical protein